MTDQEDPIVSAAVELLRAHGPLAPQDWAEMMVARGLVGIDEATELAQTLDHPMVGYLADGRIPALDTLLEGRVLTHRLSALEIAAGVLDATPDLDPLAWFDDAADEITLVFAPGGDQPGPDAAGPPWLESTGLALEPGALAGASPGDLIGLRVEGGRRRLIRIGDAGLALSEVALAELAQILAAIVPAEDTTELDGVIWQAMAESAHLFRVPAPPLAEVLSAAGLVLREGYLAHAGFDFEASRKSALIDMTAQVFHVARATAATMVEIKHLQYVPEDELPTVIGECLAEDPAAFDALDEFEIGPAICRQVDQSLAFSGSQHADTGAEAEALAEAMRAVAVALAHHAPERASAGACFLAGMMSLRLGRGPQAQAHFAQALAHDPSWTPAHREAAGLATIRGDFARALQHFERVPASERDSLHAMLTQIDRGPSPKLGRNDRCWCGSGRKYKVCHLGRPMLSAAAQATLLYNKAMEFVRTSPFVPMLVDLGDARAAHRPDATKGAASKADALGDGLIFDLLLFEGGAFADFADKMGALLPDDELLTAARWLLGGRSVYRVEAAGPGGGLTLRDLRAGDMRGGDLREVVDSGPARPGQLVCTRLVAVSDGPAGARYAAFGGLEPVDPGQLEELIALLGAAPDPFAIVELLSRRFGPAPQ